MLTTLLAPHNNLMGTLVARCDHGFTAPNRRMHRNNNMKQFFIISYPLLSLLHLQYPHKDMYENMSIFYISAEKNPVVLFSTH